MHTHFAQRRLHGIHYADHAIDGRTAVANIWIMRELRKRSAALTNRHHIDLTSRSNAMEGELQCKSKFGTPPYFVLWFKVKMNGKLAS